MVNNPLKFSLEQAEKARKRIEKLKGICEEIEGIFKEKELFIEDVIYILDMCRANLNEAQLKTPFWLSQIARGRR